MHVVTEGSREPFGKALGELLRELGYTTRSGNINWHGFARNALRDVHYETLRKAVAGERHPSPNLMERTADALHVEPTYFAEYRILQAKRAHDSSEVGFNQALKNLERWQS